MESGGGQRVCVRCGKPLPVMSKMTEEKVVNRISEALFQLEKGPGYHPRAGLAKNFVKSQGSAEASRSKAKP